MEKVNGVYVDANGKKIWTGALLRGISVSNGRAISTGRRLQRMMSPLRIFVWDPLDMKDSIPWTNIMRKYERGFRKRSSGGPVCVPQTRTVDEAKAAAKYTLEKMSGYTVKYPVAVDVESKYILDYLSVQDLTNVVNAFCDTIAAAGYTPIVYSDYSKFTNEMDTNQIKYDLWLARYGADGHYQGRTIWQCTDKGT